MPEYQIHVPEPHAKQREFIDSLAKRKIIRAGRRGGKTVGVGIFAVEKFLARKRILYAVPTSEQVDRFWTTITRALYEPIKAGVFKKNETEHIIELSGTEQRIRAKTAWNADSLRGDYGDELIFDEWQLMNEEAWGVVGAPMLLDNNGNATFIYTPPSLHSRSVSKANDPQHAAKMYKEFAEREKSGNTKYATFHFTSRDNPHLSIDALDEIAGDMTSLAYRMEILAEDVDEAPGALWTRDNIEKARVFKTPDFDRIIVGVDPTASSNGDEAGIITAGKRREDFYTIADDSCQGSPQKWATAAVLAYHRVKADLIVAEKNNGGEMVESVIKQVDPSVRVKLVWASRGKATRAEPISAISEQGRDHHIGAFPALEDELCLWIPGDDSPNRLDAKVWAYTELVGGNIKVTTSATVTNYIQGGKQADKYTDLDKR
jgi:phage terminase large subunit-like protein